MWTDSENKNSRVRGMFFAAADVSGSKGRQNSAQIRARKFFRRHLARFQKSPYICRRFQRKSIK